MKHIVIRLEDHTTEVFDLDQFLMDNPDIVEDALCSNVFDMREIIRSIYLNSMRWEMLKDIIEEIENE